MRYWHDFMPPFQEVLKCFVQAEECFFTFSNFSVEVHPPVTLCAHIPEQSAMHQKWYEPALCQKCGRLSDQSAQGVKQVLQQNPEPTKTFEFTPSLIGFSDDFDHLPTSSPSQPRCGEVPLLSSVWSAVLCRPVGSQPAAEWMRTDSPCIWPIVPSPGLGLESFLLAAPDAAARSKTSLLGRCRPSVCPRRSGRPSPRHWSYVAWAGALCERTVYRGIPWEWNRKNLISNVFSSGGGRTNLFGWKPPADISTFVTDSA